MDQANHGEPGVPLGLRPERVQALADGIFAVAMTILVLELHVPDLGAKATDDRMLSALGDLVPKVLSFASGFVILATIWIGHHFQFNYIRRSNRTILWINVVFLLTVSFLPFVVALISAYGALRVSCILYGGTLVVAMTCLLAQWLYVTRPARHLVAPALPRPVFVGLRDRVIMGIAGYGGGLLLAFVSPRASLICYAITPLLYLLPSRFDRHVRAEP